MINNTLKTLCNDYGYDYDGIVADSACYKKLYVRLVKRGKILYRVIHKGNPYDYIRHNGRIFYLF